MMKPTASNNISTAREFIAVLGAGESQLESRLKRILLFFDRAALALSREDLLAAEKFEPGGRNIRDLRRKGLIQPSCFDWKDAWGELLRHEGPSHTLSDPMRSEFVAFHTSLIRFLEALDQPADRRSSSIVEAAEADDAISASLTRLEALALRKTEVDADVVPVLSAPWRASTLGTRRHEIISVALLALPTPTSTTPWQAIHDFRQDPDSRVKRLALRQFISELTHSPFSAGEIRDKLAWMVEDYRRQISLHRMGSQWYEVLLVGTAEFIENLVKLNFGKAARSLFVLRKKKFELLETEANSPSREVAYIVKAEEWFTRHDGRTDSR